MAVITFLPDNKKVSITNTETVLDGAIKANIPLTHVCGATARCSTCRVMIIYGIDFCQPPRQLEKNLTKNLIFNPAVRLACQLKLKGNVTVRRLVIDDKDIILTNRLEHNIAFGPIGQEKLIAVLFADIRDFTALSEHVPAYDVIHILNRYFHTMGSVIENHSGYIDNYIGDGMMAIFGVSELKDAALNAVRAGITMLKQMKKMSPYFETIYDKPLRIGIGIHFGHAVVGTIGATHKKRETAIGDTVNLASRIESLNKKLNTSLLVSEVVYNLVKNQVTIGLKKQVSIKGKKDRHTIYEIKGLK